MNVIITIIIVSILTLLDLLLILKSYRKLIAFLDFKNNRIQAHVTADVKENIINEYLLSLKNKNTHNDSFTDNKNNDFYDKNVNDLEL